MDPITHALIGMAVSAAGQDKLSLLNPVTIAAVAGSVIPDGDIILQAWGGALYLKHHRGISHSIIGIAVESIIVGFALKLLYPSASLLNLVLWSFIGTLTHIISDVLNSYGARIFWPFSNKKKSLSLLTITDPVVIILAVVSIVSSYKKWGYNKYLIAIFLAYLLCKVAMHILGTVILKNEFEGKYKIEKIHLLPSMILGYKFQYIIEDPIQKIVGEVDFLFRKVRIFDILKRLDSATKERILKSKTAAFFKEFTPISHVQLEVINHGYRVLFTDLRYMFKKQFLHHATIIYDEKMNIVEEKFNPYNINKKLDV